MSFEIFIGAADHELVTGLRTQVEELPDVRIAGVETTSAALIGLVAGEPQLDAVLIDERLGPLPARDLIRELALARPHLAVVMIAETASADVLALAMEVGARGVLSRRPSLEELRSRIASAAQWTRSMRPSPDGPPGAALSSRRGEILAVSGGKGGTGTTTLAVHLALSAVGPGRSVCLVDLDLQAGDVPAYLDLAHRRSIADLAEAAGDIGGSMLAETLYVHPAGPHILLAPADGERADDVTGQTARLVLGALRARYDLVVVDCGTLMTAASITGVELADRVLVTVTPDLPALRGAKRLAGLWERLDVRNPEDVTAVLVRHSRKNEIQPDLARKILGIPLSDVTVPAAFRALEEAANTGAPGAVTDGGFRRAVQRLAADAAPAVKETAPAGGGGRFPKGGLFARGDGARDGGFVEFTGMLPLIGMVLVAVWEIFVLGMSATYASHGANEGARTAAVSGDRARIEKDSLGRMTGMWGDAKHAKVHYTTDPKNPDYGYVRVEIKAPLLFPGVFLPWTIGSRSKIISERDVPVGVPA
ncbi:AAA family ATPase [Spirillospora sp. NBC_01491]|uniref:AAA family ATPase n=1 Tax=Spirillospora sp. NBC_01491 TaxID=2976007 RepID=UPI002E326B66|nr:AAA family ATPase [Spirillospora sp. NBC_01491]